MEQNDTIQIKEKVKAHWDAIAKPIDSLGALEDMVVKLCAITKTVEPPKITKRALVVCCGDHGVVEEGVTQTGQEVTRIVAENFAKGCSTVNIFARQAGVDVFTVDVGMNTEEYRQQQVVTGQVIHRKVMRGTHNLAKEPAMSLSQCRQAITVGMDFVKELKEQGYQLLSIGEMGIGNTTPTSALAAVFLNKSAQEVTGRGAGLSEAGMHKKRQVVAQAVKRVRDKQLTNVEEILAELGGLEIAAMTGLCLGAKKYHMPMVLDGAISVVAALTAMKIDSEVTDFLFASHESEEPVGKLALQAMGLEAVIHGRMCLGEGTGAMTLLPILDMAVAAYAGMGSFTDYAIDPYERFSS